MNANELMTRNVATCWKDASLEQAARIMWEADVGCLVVTDAERHAVGMLTDRDIAMAAYTQGVRLGEASVAGAMANRVCSCSPETSAADVEALMQSAQIRRVPVVDSDGKLLGIVSLADLARSAHSSPLRMPAIPGVAKTLAVITERRQPVPASAPE
ncbi:MAG TPA: CBS domain-containing protein [Polyangiaceae bacterium]|nr:CBS domain-containing protein [Polyangiaceae bacterium]